MAFKQFALSIGKSAISGSEGSAQSATIPKRMIAIPMRQPNGTWEDRLVPTRCYGELGVSQDPSDGRREMWAVTALGCKLLVTSVFTESDATKIAEFLSEKCPEQFGKPDKKELIASLPLWVRPWVHFCREKKSYQDPEPFIVKHKWSPV